MTQFNYDNKQNKASSFEKYHIRRSICEYHHIPWRENENEKVNILDKVPFTSDDLPFKIDWYSDGWGVATNKGGLELSKEEWKTIFWHLTTIWWRCIYTGNSIPCKMMGHAKLLMYLYVFHLWHNSIYKKYSCISISKKTVH